MSSKDFNELKELLIDIFQTNTDLEAENTYLKISLNNNKNYVYVIDYDTKEIIYINDVLESAFGDIKGKLCHEALQGYYEVCNFCKSKDLLVDIPVTWVHYNKRINKLLYVIDVVKEIKGRKYKFQKATDFTDNLDELLIAINNYKNDARANG